MAGERAHPSLSHLLELVAVGQVECGVLKAASPNLQIFNPIFTVFFYSACEAFEYHSILNMLYNSILCWITIVQFCASLV